MSTMWQEIIVGLCVLFALVFVLRKYLLKGKQATGCGNCNGCGSRDKTCPK